MDGFFPSGAQDRNHGVTKTSLTFVDTHSLPGLLRWSGELILHGYMRYHGYTSIFLLVLAKSCCQLGPTQVLALWPYYKIQGQQENVFQAVYKGRLCNVPNHAETALSSLPYIK